MKTLALLSGGKDSFLSAQMAMEQGHDVQAALTTSGEIRLVDRNLNFLEGNVAEFKEPWLHGLDNYI